jgi:osmotically-inducible protein OsmY
MGRHNEYRYGRGGQRYDRDRADDRGYMDRAGDEVRSWMGDEDAERRRRMDEQHDREHQRRHASDWNRQGSGRADWNRSSYSSPDRDRSNRNRQDWHRSNWNPTNWDDRARAAADRSPEDWRHRDSSMRFGESGGASDWDRDRGMNRADYRDQYGYAGGYRDDVDSSRFRNYDTGRYRDDDRYAMGASRPSGEWSVDNGRTEFGRDARWGRGPKGYQRSDSRVLEDVCDRLTYSDVDAENIEVRVENGEVTLSGSVPDRSDKRRAEDVVEAVSGVRDVHNNIRVSRGDRGIGQSDTSSSSQPGTVLGVNPTASSTITNAPPKART